MAFPEVPRVFYEISPLDEVICQFKFPPILRIEADLPAAFQEQVRGEFPLFDSIDASPLPPDMPEDLARILQSTTGIIPLNTSLHLGTSGQIGSFDLPDHGWAWLVVDTPGGSSSGSGWLSRTAPCSRTTARQCFNTFACGIATSFVGHSLKSAETCPGPIY